MSASAIAAVIGAITAVIVAVVGVVYRLGSRQGEAKTLLETLVATVRDIPTAFKQLRDELDDHKQMIKGCLDRQDKKIAVLETKWETAHLLVEKVNNHEIEIQAMKAVCKERRGVSMRVHARTEEEDDSGVVEAIAPVSCPLTDEEKE